MSADQIIENANYILGVACVVIATLIAVLAILVNVIISRINKFMETANVKLENLAVIRSEMEHLKDRINEFKVVAGQAAGQADRANERISIVERDMKAMWHRYEDLRRNMLDIIDRRRVEERGA